MNTTITKDFKVIAVSSNTNSFGLKQMIMIAQDGNVFKGCFNYLNVKNEGNTIQGTLTLNSEGIVTSTTFTGGELIEKLKNAPEEMIANVFN